MRPCTWHTQPSPRLQYNSNHFQIYQALFSGYFPISSHNQVVFLPKFLLQLLSLCGVEAISELSTLYYPLSAVMATHYSHTCLSWSHSHLCSAGIGVGWLLGQPAAHSSSPTLPPPIPLRMLQGCWPHRHPEIAQPFTSTLASNISFLSVMQAR